MKFMAINTVTDLEYHLFFLFLKKQRDGDNTLKQLNLPLICHPLQKNTLAA